MSKTQTGYPIEPGTKADVTVRAVGEMIITGNVTPRIWYQRVVTPRGNADTIAITLLSEIVCRNSPTKDTRGKEEPRKHYAGEYLQKTYRDLTKEFNLSKSQLEKGAKRLEELGIITRHRVNGVRAYGQLLNNVLYFELHHEVLNELTFAESWKVAPEQEGMAPQGAMGAFSGATPVTNGAAPVSPGETNTKTTPKTPPKTDLKTPTKIPIREGAVSPSGSSAPPPDSFAISPEDDISKTPSTGSASGFERSEKGFIDMTRSEKIHDTHDTHDTQQNDTQQRVEGGIKHFVSEYRAQLIHYGFPTFGLGGSPDTDKIRNMVKDFVREDNDEYICEFIDFAFSYWPNIQASEPHKSQKGMSFFQNDLYPPISFLTSAYWYQKYLPYAMDDSLTLASADDYTDSNMVAAQYSRECADDLEYLSTRNN